VHTPDCPQGGNRTKRTVRRLKNQMIGANFMANFIAVFCVNSLLYWAEGGIAGPLPTGFLWFDILFSPAAFILIFWGSIIYERPIRRAIPLLLSGKEVPPGTLLSARRRLLNEPYVLIGMDLVVWIAAAIIYPLLFWVYDFGALYVHRALYMSLSSGCIAILMAFFLLEHKLQKRLAPLFFPEGGMNSVAGTLRIRIRTRMAALLLAVNVIPLLVILHTLYRLNLSAAPSADILHRVQVAIATNAIIFLLCGLVLGALVSHNLSAPFQGIITILGQIRRGRYDGRVPVITNDEIGYTGEMINAMNQGLQERESLRESLRLAMEVQQSLMPSADPLVGGLEVAGTCIYCDQTGGDYYDYLTGTPEGSGALGVLVGDVSDHGIPSALLMASGRAFLRQRATMGGGLARIVEDVNHQICGDVEDSGRFMTLFFGEIDRPAGRIRWVSAGHEPALVYDTRPDRFRELTGGGLPLGIMPEARYREHSAAIAPGQIIIIATDGIWENRNGRGEMFGKQRFRALVRQKRDLSARDIVAHVIRELLAFSGPRKVDDDITLVVVKVLDKET
jgi:sigma-B regulation protein RsbU (phosphoserine phosphatase)